MVAANSAPCGSASSAGAACRISAKICCSTTARTPSTSAFPARIVERNTYEIPDHVSYQDAALIEPLACVLRGFEETGSAPGDTVAIIGLGPIGLMFVRLAKLYGCRVIAVGRRQTQLDRAARHGRRRTDRRRRDTPIPSKPVRELTDGRGADIAIEAVGKPRDLGTGPSNGAPRRHRQLLRRLPQRQPRQPRYRAAALLRDHLQGQFPPHPGYIRKASTSSAAATSPPSIFVNREEPLANLLEVMRHLMSHNGHLKTAIIP